MKFGAGVQTYEAIYAAASHNLSVIGGTCPTVSVAGGYTQGGGHGMLVSSHGLSADTALEWEVVTAKGQRITASPSQNTDLYWALSGGGPGTYGVVTSLTMKAFPEELIGGATLGFTSSGVSQQKYWNAIGSWHEFLPTIVDNEGTANYLIAGSGFNVTQITLPGCSERDVTALLQSFTRGLDNLGVNYTMSTSSYATYRQHYDHYIGLPYGVDPSNQSTGSRLIPRSVILSQNAKLTKALQNITSDPNFTIIGTALNVNRSMTQNDAMSNSILPAWRETLTHLIISGLWNYTAPWADNLEVEDKIAKEIVPLLSSITPSSGTYMNEANFQQATWKADFYGENYSRLRAIKFEYDPTNLLYALTAVGSDEWSVSNSGRMCRVAK